jgi:hypothetical protein
MPARVHVGTLEKAERRDLDQVRRHNFCIGPAFRIVMHRSGLQDRLA